MPKIKKQETNNYENKQWFKNYFKDIISNIKEQEILTPTIKTTLNPIGNKKLAYRNDEEYILTLHALSQIPMEFIEIDSLNELDNVTLINNGIGLKWTGFARHFQDPYIPNGANGYYYIFYDHSEKEYTFGFEWTEDFKNNPVNYSTIISWAQHFTTQKELLNFITKARSFGVQYWLKERANIEQNILLGKQIEQSAIEALKNELP